MTRIRLFAFCGRDNRFQCVKRPHDFPLPPLSPGLLESADWICQRSSHMALPSQIEQVIRLKVIGTRRRILFRRRNLPDGALQRAKGPEDRRQLMQRRPGPEPAWHVGGWLHQPEMYPADIV